MDKQNRRILIIDDNRAVHNDFRKILTAAAESSQLDEAERRLFDDPPAAPAYELDSAFQGQEGYEKVVAALKADKPYALAFVDMRMPPGWDGMQTTEKIWEADPQIQIVICTAFSDYGWEDFLAKFGATDRLLILKKPFDTEEVCQLACALSERWQAARHAHLKLNQMNATVAEQEHQLRRTAEENQRSERRLQTCELRYALASTATNDGLWDWNLETQTVYYSPRWKEMLGLDDSITSAPDEWLKRLDMRDRPVFLASLEAHLAGRTNEFQAEYRIARHDGRYCWMFCRGLAVRGPDGRAVRIAGSQTDITDRKVAEEQLHYASEHDALTGLTNRTTLMDKLELNLQRIRLNATARFAVMVLDLDRFNNINERLGRAVGDELVVAVSKRLTLCLRDCAGPLGIKQCDLFRIGGDQFVVLLTGIADERSAPRVAERLQASLATAFYLRGQEVFISSSIGVAMGHSGYKQSEDIMRDADTAVFHARSASDKHLAIFNEKMHSETMARWRTENDLRGAIERDELQLYYQPIVSLATGRVVELESLVRWHHPRRGLVQPLDFIPLAEETGLIIALGAWALRKACHDLHAWVTRLPEMSALGVGVNLSGKQLSKHGLAEEITAILKEEGLAPHQLRLEITETSMMENTAEAMAAINAIRQLDLRLHLDDFGTGYSSLSYLRRLPIDALKIDRTFVSSMETDPVNRSIVQAVVALAHSLNLDVIGEGIETKRQAEHLRSIGCNHGQGFYFSKPIPAEAMIEYLTAANAEMQLASA